VKNDKLIETKCQQYCLEMKNELLLKFVDIDGQLSELRKQLETLGDRAQQQGGSVVSSKVEEMEKKLEKLTYSQVVQGGTVTDQPTQEKLIENSAREMEDRENRRENLIWFGIAECDSDEAETRKQADTDYITQLGEKVFGFTEPGSFTVARRLGKRVEGGACRPLLTKMASSEQVKTTLKKAKELGRFEEYKKVTVKKDMTPLEREQMRRLVKMRNQRREETKQKESGEVWVVRNGRVVDIARKHTPKEEGGRRE
jgi:ribosomal protein L17